MYNEPLRKQFLHFKNRADTFSLGVCNGCQLMSLLGWVGVEQPKFDDKNKGIVAIPDVALAENRSERFECRWSTVRIESSPAIMLENMAGFVIGCWIAHHEGRFTFKSPDIVNKIMSLNLAPIRYVNDNGHFTNVYPMNPNGSILGIAALCSLDGRHLAMMPHPERCTKMWQWPYVSPNYRFSHTQRSPWQMMFDNAFKWCC